nr:FHA domain-containing protein [Lachnospiraceae bacterium]
MYTVGTNHSSGEKRTIISNLQGSDKKGIKKAARKIEKTKYLKSKKSKTVLYRSLNEVLASQQTAASRTVILMVTDGEDDSIGKDIDQKSTANEVKNATVPVYGILLHNVASKPNKAKMKYTQYKILNEKNCRGYYEDCSQKSSAKNVKKAFRVIRHLWEKDSYVVSLCADSNRTVGKTKLKLTVNQQGIDPVLIDYADYEEDSDAPIIVGAVKKISSNAISFSLQDENGVNLDDANDPSHYIIQSEAEEKDGKIWTISDISIKNNGDEIAVTLTVDEDFFTDQYVLICNDIHDNSQDSNAMSGISIDFTIEDGLDRLSIERKEFVKSYWWIALMVLVVILGIMIVTVIKKRPGKIEKMDPGELHKADSKLIRFTITDRSGAMKDVEWNIEGSLFIGRSKICNIDFDDDRLSKQHFVVEVTKMGCYIEDLESTNGTFVNGVKMTNRRLLLDGDVITAGREKFVFHLPKS